MTKDEALKTIWGALFLEGKLTNGKHSFYGGFEYLKGQSSKAHEETSILLDSLLPIIKRSPHKFTDVDALEYLEQSEFTDTFNPAETVKCILGKFIIAHTQFQIVWERADDVIIDLLEQVKDVGFQQTKDYRDFWK